MVTSAKTFSYIQEQEDSFLALFPHRFDYIYAKHPNAGDSPQWQTETRHPLADRVLQQGAYLYGVRFGAQTKYCLIDIDAGSRYHPQNDPLAIARIVSALEAIGLATYLACTSSYSGGIHLYLPFQQAQNSWAIASVVGTLLENAGFTLQPGQIEIFPNPKPYSIEEQPNLFQAHRLPLQTGSYLLNDDWQPVWSNQQQFVQQWQLAQQQNNVENKTIQRILKQARRKHYRISGKADKFINDLNAEIELGWTGHGQTNRLLGRITLRAFIFQHVLFGGEPLEGQALTKEIVRVARSLPGYQEWCRHQHEIEHRAEEWTRCIENSHYFHYGNPDGKFQAKQESELGQAIEQAPSWNQQQSAAARDRIRSAIADLLEKNILPGKATARFHALLSYGIGGGSLYRHRDLWHPAYLASPDDREPESPPSLFPAIGGDVASSNESSDRTTLPQASTVGNVSSSDVAVGLDFSQQYVQPVLFDLKSWPEVHQAAVHHADRHRQRIRQEASQSQSIARMQKSLASDDPILLAEALAWAQVNPGVLDCSQLQIPLERCDRPAPRTE